MAIQQKTKQKQTALNRMTLHEIRKKIEELTFDLPGGKNEVVFRKVAQLPTSKIKEMYENKKDIYEELGAVRNGAVIIPNNWNKSLYYLIELKIREMELVEYAKTKI